MRTLYKMRIKTGDIVMVRSGKYKGRTGKVLAVHPKINKITVEGINVVKKHRKPSNAHPQGAIEDITMPLWASKVGVVDATAKKPSRVVYKIDDKGHKTRVLKSSGKELK